jgi:predicted regulator of Ras-like GTPase activity (Roadblock/LC7/MglB family)
MSGADLVLHEEDFNRLMRIADRLRRESNARFIAVIDRNGQPIAWTGEVPDVDRTALASLAAGNVAATEVLARMTGERAFSSMYHEGDRDHLHLSAVGDAGILLVAFDERSSLGLVRLRVRQFTPDLVQVFVDMSARSHAFRAGMDELAAALPEISDEDIENLFRDGL